MSEPRFTIIIASHNHKRHIERAICSVLDQPFEDTQLIVVDRGSTDGSVDVIKLYEDEIDELLIKPDFSATKAINAALMLATGEYIGVLHGDEVLEPDALHFVDHLIEDDNGPMWVSGGCACVDQFEFERGCIQPQAPKSLAQLLMRESGHFASASTFFARHMIEEVGALSDSLNEAYMYDLWCRFMAAQHMPAVTNEVLSVRHDNTAKLSPNRVLDHGRELIDIAERYTEKLPMTQRYALWANCDHRRRIYALAEAEANSDEAQSFMLNQLLRHPWWLANPAVRHTVMHGVDHPLPPDSLAA